MRVRRVEDFGIAPNWLGSISAKTAGPMYLLTSNSSATLDRARVREMGRICLVPMVTGFTFISGETSASFHDRGSFCSANDEFKISQSGEVRKAAYTQPFSDSAPKRALQTSDGLTIKTSESSKSEEDTQADYNPALAQEEPF